MRITADQSRCVGAGMCALTAPGVFDQDAEDGRVKSLVTHPSADQVDLVRAAVAVCPSRALGLDEVPTADRANDR